MQDLGLLWLRLLMGAGIAYHGYGLVFGGQVAMLTAGVRKWGVPMPEALAWAAALSEFAGGICVALGLGTRVAAAAVFTTMSVAWIKAHAADPFQVKELALAYWTMAGALILMGGGACSLDARLFGGRSKPRSKSRDSR